MNESRHIDAGRARLGAWLIGASAVVFSTAGLLAGLVAGVDAWTVLFWRGLFGGLFIAAFVLARHATATPSVVWEIGGSGLAVAACSTASTICFIHALRHTTVAEVTILYAVAPLVAALVARLWLGERTTPTTLCASALAFSGVLLIARPHDAGVHVLGNLLALTMTVLVAVMMVIVRHHRRVSMLPAACLSAFGCALIALPFARPLAVLGADLLWLGVLGVGQFGLGLLLLTLGTRLVPAPRAALLGNIELPLAPLWVWLAFGQVPAPAVWIGGLVIVLALGLDSIAGARSRHGGRSVETRRRLSVVASSQTDMEKSA